MIQGEYTKKEFSELTGLSVSQIKRLCAKGVFSIDGLGQFTSRRSGGGKTSPILIFSVSGEGQANIEELKRQKLALTVEQLKLKNIKTIEEIEKRYRNDILDQLFVALAKVRAAILELNLDPEAIKKFNSKLSLLVAEMRSDE